MTFASKSLTGTRVYARGLFRAVHESGKYDLSETSAAGHMRAARTGNALTGAQNLWWLQARLPRLLARERAELFHAAAYLGPLAAPCPMIVNVLDTTIFVVPRDFDWKWRLYARGLIPPTIRRAAAILTLSEHARAEIIRRYNAPAERVHVVYPGIGGEFRAEHDEQALARVRASYELNAPYLLFVGAQEPRKNIPALVGALAQVRARCPDVILALVGPRGRGAAEVQRAITCFGLGSAVRELGYVPPSDLPPLYAGARAMVYASRFEGFGMPPVEAMACGTSVVAAPNPPLPEILGDAALFAADDSPAALAQSILRVLTEPELADTLRARGREHARQFSWARAAQTTLEVYSRVLAERRVER